MEVNHVTSRTTVKTLLRMIQVVLLHVVCPCGVGDGSLCWRKAATISFTLNGDHHG